MAGVGAEEKMVGQLKKSDVLGDSSEVTSAQGRCKQTTLKSTDYTKYSKQYYKVKNVKYKVSWYHNILKSTMPVIQVI